MCVLSPLPTLQSPLNHLQDAYLPQRLVDKLMYMYNYVRRCWGKEGGGLGWCASLCTQSCN